MFCNGFYRFFLWVERSQYIVFVHLEKFANLDRKTMNWTLFCLANSSCNLCLIMFVFLQPELCRQLPSDSTSQ